MIRRLQPSSVAVAVVFAAFMSIAVYGRGAVWWHALLAGPAVIAAQLLAFVAVWSVARRFPVWIEAPVSIVATWVVGVLAFSALLPS